MSKAVLLSIRPDWVKKIASGDKTVEVRKTRPRIDTPFKCYIYCTQASPYNPCVSLHYRRQNSTAYDSFFTARVIGEFVCDRMERFDVPFPAYMNLVDTRMLKAACLSYQEAHNYLGHKSGYGWHISDLKIYEKPKELEEFSKWQDGITDIRPCQNGKGCEHLYFDYSEDCEACGIDFDGENCLYLKVQRPPQSWMYVEELE